MTVSDLPALNATLNAIATVFISAGWYWIRRGFWQRHIVCMVASIVTSAAFLVSYLTYHYLRGGQSTRFAGEGPVAVVYYFILITHILLAFIILPLVIATLVPVFRRRWDRHRRLGKWTMPVWLYVSVTGVIVYFMLYRWFPPPDLAPGG